jgi:UDP-galactose transporter
MEKGIGAGKCVWLSILAGLVIQNSSLALFMRYSRVAFPLSMSYISSTAVFCAECLKLVIAVVCCYWLDCDMSLSAFVLLLQREIGENKWECVLLMVPSLLYTLQNNLQFLATSNLPADVFQALSQSKVVTTAIFSVVLLKRKISRGQWISILALVSGILLVQFNFEQKKKSVGPDSTPQNPLFGLCCVLTSSVTSGFAGCYVEKILKSKSSSSIWVRNIQLSLIGIYFSGLGSWLNDGDEIMQAGFFKGYNWVVGTVILLSAAGGMLVAAVMKYADNVVKGFAVAISLVLSSIISNLFLEDTVLNFGFFTGATVVCLSAFMYSRTGEATRPPKLPH